MPVMQTGDKMMSPYLEEFKPAGGINARVAVLDQHKVSGVQGHWVAARDRGGQEIKGFYQCLVGQCCQAIGAPSQYYLLPIWVYTDLPNSSGGTMMYLKLTKTAYQAFVQLCQVTNFSAYDMWIMPTDQGKGVRLQFSAAMDGSYLTQEERQGLLVGMDPLFWDTLDRAVVKPLEAAAFQDVIQFYLTQNMVSGQMQPQGQLMNQGGARPGMMGAGMRPGQAQIPAPQAQPQYQQQMPPAQPQYQQPAPQAQYQQPQQQPAPQAQYQQQAAPLAQPQAQPQFQQQAVRPGMQPQAAAPLGQPGPGPARPGMQPQQAAQPQFQQPGPGPMQQQVPPVQYQQPSPQQQQAADFALQQQASMGMSPQGQPGPGMQQQVRPQQAAQPSFMLAPQAQQPQATPGAMPGDFEVIPEAEANQILDGPVPGNPL